jgi:dolichyl-phosphate beta-glucosyltransferase
MGEGDLPNREEGHDGALPIEILESVPPRWSVIIPAFNEEKRLPAYLEEIIVYFDGRRQRYEIVVVDDGSQDDTGTAVGSLRDSYHALRLVRLPYNRGKGYAVRTGMLEAVGELRLFADADGATPIREVEKLEERITAGVDIAIGSRALRDSTCRVQAKWHRVVLGQIFNTIVRCLNVRGIADTQCGFKLLHAQAAKDIFSVLRVDGYGFDVELLFVAQQRGYRIAEVPVNWSDQAGTKVRVMRDGLRMLREVWSIRSNQLHGLYSAREVSSSLSGRLTSHG